LVKKISRVTDHHFSISAQERACDLEAQAQQDKKPQPSIHT